MSNNILQYATKFSYTFFLNIVDNIFWYINHTQNRVYNLCLKPVTN